MTVWYEWDLEEYDMDVKHPDAEIVDHSHGNSLNDVGFPVECKQKLVLVRNSENNRMWAYVDESRMLPAEFTQPNAEGEYVSVGIKVPQKFHREIARYACG